MKIAILGTRGVPNHYGGFEQFAEYLAAGLVEKGVDVSVYNSHSHPYKNNIWKGVKLIHKLDPENNLGTFGQFIYDLNCIVDARNKEFDIILQLGYTSSSIWGWLMPSRSVITTNMDGLEWRRSKYSNLVRRFLKYAEYLGVKYSDHLISDSLGIQSYLKEKYNVESLYIPYGATRFNNPSLEILKGYSLDRYHYDMLIARLEPENNIEPILKGVSNSNNQRPFLVVGNFNTKFGQYLRSNYTNEKIRFLGGIYDINVLNNLRYFSNLYFHGHSVGGTNPSLLEAMSSNSLIVAHDNVFNKTILEGDAFYFKSCDDVSRILDSVEKLNFAEIINNNYQKIEKIYSWDIIIEKYYNHFSQIIN